MKTFWASFLALIQTKTFWGGVATVVAGIQMIQSGNLDAGIQTILGGLVAIFIRDAIRKDQQDRAKAAVDAWKAAKAEDEK